MNKLDLISTKAENKNILERHIKSYIDKNVDKNKEELDLIYEIGFLLKQEKTSLKNTFDLLKNSQLSLSHPHFQDVSKRILEMDHFMDKPFEVVEGVNQCGNSKCGGQRTLSYSRQTRGGDEGMTVYVFCIDCKTRYVMNS
jgi:DNA-directed RNA polymerase subunit M/transcription elongation factor TFIIS